MGGQDTASTVVKITSGNMTPAVRSLHDSAHQADLLKRRLAQYCVNADATDACLVTKIVWASYDIETIEKVLQYEMQCVLHVVNMLSLHGHQYDALHLVDQLESDTLVTVWKNASVAKALLRAVYKDPTRITDDDLRASGYNVSSSGAMTEALKLYRQQYDYNSRTFHKGLTFLSVMNPLYLGVLEDSARIIYARK